MKRGAVVVIGRRGAGGEESIGREEETESWVSEGRWGNSASLSSSSFCRSSGDEEIRRRFIARSSIL